MMFENIQDSRLKPDQKPSGFEDLKNEKARLKQLAQNLENREK